MASTGGLCGKVVLITGASCGIGARTSLELARRGARLALTGRNAANLDRVADDCWRHLATTDNNGGERPLTIIAELTDDDDVRRIVDKTVEKFGRLDVLINNAGMVEFGTLEETSMEQYDRIMSVNLRAVYHLMMLAVPHLIATKGNVVNVSSTGGSRVYPRLLAHCVAKSGLDHMTRCAALELAGKGVRVNAVAPGFVRSTGILQRCGFTDELVAKRTESMKSAHPLGRVGEPEDVASAIVFLTSDDASFITGHILTVDGGRGLTSASVQPSQAESDG